MATAAKERSVEELDRELGRLAGERERREAGLEEVRRELAPALARKDELRRKGWDGVNVTRELAQLEERIAGLERREQDGVEDLRVGAERVAGLTQERDAAQSREDRARTVALAAEIKRGTEALAEAIREALVGPINRLQELGVMHQQLIELWEGVYKTQFYGGKPLVQINHAIVAVLTTLNTLGESR